jgi:hypothetical protein
MSLPELTFIYAYPLDVELRRSFEDRGQIYPNQDEIKIVMDRWKKIWQEVNLQHDILGKMSESVSV